jgi:hypothetical protein
MSLSLFAILLCIITLQRDRVNADTLASCTYPLLDTLSSQVSQLNLSLRTSVDSLRVDLASNATRASNLVTSTETISSQLIQLNSTVAQRTIDLVNLTNAVTGLQNRSVDVSALSSQVSSQAATVAANTANIATHTLAIAANTANIASSSLDAGLYTPLIVHTSLGPVTATAGPTLDGITLADAVATVNGTVMGGSLSFKRTTGAGLSAPSVVVRFPEVRSWPSNVGVVLTARSLTSVVYVPFVSIGNSTGFVVQFIATGGINSALVPGKEYQYTYATVFWQ